MVSHVNDVKADWDRTTAPFRTAGSKGSELSGHPWILGVASVHLLLQLPLPPLQAAAREIIHHACPSPLALQSKVAISSAGLLCPLGCLSSGVLHILNGWKEVALRLQVIDIP